MDFGQLQLKNQRMISQCQKYHDNTDDESTCERITHLHRPKPRLNCGHAILRWTCDSKENTSKFMTLPLVLSTFQAKKQCEGHIII